MTIKLITIDIDGTLLNSKKELTFEVKEAIKKAKQQGVHVVLATGRPTVGVMAFVEELGLNQDDNYVITYNGALIQNVGTKEILKKHPLTHDDYLDIELMSRKLGVHLHVQDNDTMYTANTDISKYTIVEATLTTIPLEYKPVYLMTDKIDIIKAMMVEDEEQLDEAIERLPQEFKERFSVVKSAPYYLEILNKEATKGDAVKELAELLNIKQEEIMAIGDNENDLTMIEYAGMGVAMDNAVRLVKDVATHVTKSHDEHGVAHAINTWVLK